MELPWVLDPMKSSSTRWKTSLSERSYLPNSGSPSLILKVVRGCGLARSSWSYQVSKTGQTAIWWTTLIILTIYKRSSTPTPPCYYAHLRVFCRSGALTRSRKFSTTFHFRVSSWKIDSRCAKSTTGWCKASSNRRSNRVRASNCSICQIKEA